MNERKDRAKALFQQKRFSEAATAYQGIADDMEDSQPDKDKMLVNMGLCHCKLRNYREAIDAYERALRTNPRNAKASYRMMKEYEELQKEEEGRDHAYDIVVNAANYVEKTGPKDDNYAEVTRTQTKYKRVLCELREMPERLSKSQKETCEQLCKCIQKEKPQIEDEDLEVMVDKDMQEWFDEWKESGQSEDAKIEEVKMITEDVDAEHGINLAYLLLNNTKDQKQRQYIVRQIQKLKKKLNGERGDEDSQQELEYSPESQIPKPKASASTVKTAQKSIENKKVEPVEPKKAGVSIQDALNNKKQKLAKVNNDKEQKQEIKPVSKAPQPKVQVVPQPKPTPAPKPVEEVKKSVSKAEEEFEKIFEKYGALPPKPKDMFAQTFKAVIRTLDSKLPQQTKRKVLCQIRNRTKKIKVIIMSFSQQEQKSIQELLRKSGLEELGLEWAPNVYKL